MFLKNEYDKPKYNPFETPEEIDLICAKQHVTRMFNIIQLLKLDKDFSKIPYDNVTVYTTRKLKDEIERTFTYKNAKWIGGEIYIPCFMTDLSEFFDKERNCNNYMKFLIILLYEEFRKFYGSKIKEARIDCVNRWLKVTLYNEK